MNVINIGWATEKKRIYWRENEQLESIRQSVYCVPLCKHKSNNQVSERKHKKGKKQIRANKSHKQIEHFPLAEDFLRTANKLVFHNKFSIDTPSLFDGQPMLTHQNFHEIKLCKLNWECKKTRDRNHNKYSSMQREI